MLDKLQKLFPKWKLSYDKYHYIKIETKYFNTTLFNIHDINLKNIQDIYNSNEYIIEFLLLNGFVQINDYNTYEYCNKKINITIYISMDFKYIINNTFNNTKSFMNSTQLIKKLKEILDIESRNKLINV